MQSVDLHTKRERIGVGVAFVPRSNWQTAVQYRHEEKEGKMATAGSFFFNAAQLVEPVDYVAKAAPVERNWPRLSSKPWISHADSSISIPWTGPSSGSAPRLIRWARPKAPW